MGSYRGTVARCRAAAGVCSRVHLRRLLRLSGVSLDIGDSFDRETESSDAGTGLSAGTELYLPEK